MSRLISSPLRGGKTGPRLSKDLQLYNPQYTHPQGINILTDLPIHDDNPKVTSRYSPNACKHVWFTVLKEHQVEYIDRHVKLDSSKFCCRKCRVHLWMQLQTDGPCTPLHHWFQQGPSSAPIFETLHRWDVSHLFWCSRSACDASLKITMSAQRLSEEHRRLLTDRELIKKRAQSAIDSRPDHMDGIRIPLPLNVLSNLRTYLEDAKANPKPRMIKGNSKKWLQCFGTGCDELLNQLGFRKDEENWIPPHPQLTSDEHSESRFLEVLDDILTELNILIANEPENERQQGAFEIKNLSPKQEDLEALLQTTAYQKSTASRTQGVVPYDEEHPFYASLGGVQDMHDDVLSQLYHWQVAIDSDNQPYYFDCLSGIATGRRSEDLDTQVALLASQGYTGTQATLDAYKALGLSVDDNYDDEALIGSFKARIPDAPMQEPDLRKALGLIGKHRKSAAIQNFVANSIITYEQAISFLRVDEHTTDDGVIASAQVQVSACSSGLC